MKSSLFTVLSKSCRTRLPRIYKKSTVYNSLFEKLAETSKSESYYQAKPLDFSKVLLAEADAYSVVSFKFSHSNTLFSVATSCGKTVFSGSAGSLGLKGKQKTNRQVAVKKISRTLKEIYPFLIEFSPAVALHLVNVGSSKSFIVRTLKSFFLITSIKSFDLVPYNGCRKKKVRRKKIVMQLPK